MGRLVVVCGLPGAGKTTLARALEVELGAVRLSADDWLVDLGIDLFDVGARERVERLQRRLSDRLLSLGHRVVVEWGTWGRAERDDLREGARRLGAAVELHVVDAPVEVLWERVRARAFEQAGSRALTRQDLRSAPRCSSAPMRPSSRCTKPRFRSSTPAVRPGS